MKTPDEIKGSLKPTSFIVGIFGKSAVVREDTLKNALAYIQQLDAELSDAKSNHQHTIDIAEKQKKQIDKLKKVIVRLNKERNAAVDELKSLHTCGTCRHEILAGSPRKYTCQIEDFDCDECSAKGCPCTLCRHGSNWEWRGVKEDIDND